MPFPGPVGQSFTRDLRKDGEFAAEYNNTLGREAKAKFRQKWCQGKLEACEKKLTKETKQILTDETVGVYLPFRKLWESEGLDESGYQATGCKTASCTLLWALAHTIVLSASTPGRCP